MSDRSPQGDGAVDQGESAMRSPDPGKLNASLGKMVGDLGVIASGALVLLGDHLGLYQAMRDGEKITAAEVARRAGAGERHVSEWLVAQPAAGYVDYDEGEECFRPSTASLRSLSAARASLMSDAGTARRPSCWPNSHFSGFDSHVASIERARKAAAEDGVAANTSFDVAPAKSYPGTYDLVAFFDCLHDMGDPVGAPAHVRETSAPDGAWMIVEPMAHDHLSGRLNPMGRVFYSASAMICTPASLAQEVELGLGAQAGELKLRQVVTAGGFTRFRRASETPFNMVREARP
jgi:hypothetical protein